MGRPRHRTFTGCWRCRKRKVKCDESKPDCKACRRIGVACTGYGPKLIWVENDTQVYKSDGRRAFACDQTWAGYEAPPFDLVGSLISLCDGVGNAELQLRNGRLGCHNPFSAFSLTPTPLPPVSEQVPKALCEFPDLAQSEKSLFHHYANHVAIIMMPYDHPRNPWKLYYPAVALSRASSDRNTLYHAVLAQAAFNLASLKGDDGRAMMALGFEHYGLALKQLIGEVHSSERDFDLAISSIMTMMFAEVYAGLPQKWWCHFEGAWKLLQKFRFQQPWNMAHSICVSLQSLSIVKIIGQTSKLEPVSPGSVEDDKLNILEPIATTAEFGFTIGAPVAVLQCISEIDRFRTQMRRGDGVADRDVSDVVGNVLCRLKECEGATLVKSLEQSDPLGVGDSLPSLASSHIYYQEQAFIYATYVYLYRNLLGAPPDSVQVYVRQTLELYSQFASTCPGNFSLWPPFIAAVEAYKEEDMEAARRWLESMVFCGIGSRPLGWIQG
ncbi:fungal-specific transcription factor domain-containing protein [Xylariaceae sp. FL0594]|nr:fungal-specific transcription factor domain-containing protein [Xylariaceae sp. FL0594]